MNSIVIQYQWTGIDSIASKFWLVLLQLMHIFSLSDIHVYDFEITNHIQYAWVACGRMQ